MLTRREQIMNMELSKDNSFIIKRECISKKSVIGFKENGNEILRKNNTEEIEKRQNNSKRARWAIQRFREAVQRESKLKTQS